MQQHRNRAGRGFLSWPASASSVLGGCRQAQKRVRTKHVLAFWFGGSVCSGNSAWAPEHRHRAAAGGCLISRRRRETESVLKKLRWLSRPLQEIDKWLLASLLSGAVCTLARHALWVEHRQSGEALKAAVAAVSQVENSRRRACGEGREHEGGS